jgi:valyl-tRNA synthetase
MMPFVTEELWQTLLSTADVNGVRPSPSIVIAPWPAETSARDATAEAQMDAVFEIVRGVRNLRAEYRVDPGRWVPATIVAGDDVDVMRSVAAIIGDLPGCRLRPVEAVSRLDAPIEHAVTIVAGGVTVYIPLAGLMDVAQELARLQREQTEVTAEIDRAEGLLARPGFVEKARPDVVVRERDKVASLRERLAKLDEHIHSLIS